MSDQLRAVIENYQEAQIVVVGSALILVIFIQPSKSLQYFVSFLQPIRSRGLESAIEQGAHNNRQSLPALSWSVIRWIENGH